MEVCEILSWYELDIGVRIQRNRAVVSEEAPKVGDPKYISVYVLTFNTKPEGSRRYRYYLIRNPKKGDTLFREMFSRIPWRVGAGVEPVDWNTMVANLYGKFETSF